jgi:hypothetical protein
MLNPEEKLEALIYSQPFFGGLVDELVRLGIRQPVG